MKNLFTISCISLFLFTAFAAQSQSKFYNEYLKYNQENGCSDMIMQFKPAESPLVDTVKCYYWMNADEEWTLNIMHINTYDDYNRLKETVTRYLDFQTYEFKNVLRHTYTYYSTDSVKTYLQELWNEELDGGSWDETSLNEYEYDDQNRLIYKLTYFSPYGSHELNFGNREYYSYNDQGLLDTTITQYWNTNENKWFYSYRYRNYYDSQLRLTGAYMDWANNQQGDYSLYQRDITAYDDIVGTSEKITQYYSNNLWENSFRESSTFNEMQLPDSILHQQWNTLDLMWDTTVMELALYNYNESGKLTEYITLSYYLFFVYNQRLTWYYDENDMLVETLSQQWDFTNEEWTNKSNCFYPSPPVIAGLDFENSPLDELVISPNPVRNHAEIKITGNLEDNSRMLVYNINGQMVYEELLNKNTSQIPIKLNPGLYIAMIVSENQISTTKLVVR